MRLCHSADHVNKAVWQKRGPKPIGPRPIFVAEHFSAEKSWFLDFQLSRPTFPNRSRIVGDSPETSSFAPHNLKLGREGQMFD